MNKEAYIAYVERQRQDQKERILCEKIYNIVNEIVNIERYMTKKTNNRYLYLQIPDKDQQTILNLLERQKLDVKIVDDCIRILMVEFSKKIIVNKGEKEENLNHKIILLNFKN